MQELVKTYYRTEDGKEFDKEESAQHHESLLEDLKKFEIGRSAELPYISDKCMLSECEYVWYKINNREELKKLLSLIDSAYEPTNFSLLQHAELKYPVLLAHNRVHRRIVSFSELENKHLQAERKWNKLLTSIQEMNKNV